MNLDLLINRDELRERLEQTFQRILKPLMRSIPDLTITTGYSHNATFPFRAYATLACTARQRVIDVSVDCKRVADHLEINADVARESGELLSAMPTYQLLLSPSVSAADGDQAFTEIVRYLENQVDLIRAALTG